MLVSMNPTKSIASQQASNRLLSAVLTLVAVGCYAPSVAAQESEIPGLAFPQEDAAQIEPVVGRVNQRPATKGATSSRSSSLPLSEALDRRGDLTLRGSNSSIESALFAISEIWKVNIVVGKDVKGTVSGVFKQAPLREILDSILLANGYSYRAVGESLVVQAAKDVGSAHPLFRSMTLPIQHGNLQEIVDAATLLKSTEGQVRALTSARSMLVIDYADRVKTIESFVNRMESAAENIAAGPQGPAAQQLEVAYFHTQFVPAQDVKAALQSILSEQGRIEVMTAQNRVIVVDFASNIEMVRRVLSRIDRPRPQVRITALIYDLSLEDVEKLGLNWNSGGKGNSLDGDGGANQLLQLDTRTITPFPATSAAGSVTVRSLTRNFDITTVAIALQTATDARLLADPNVTVMDNEIAEWESVSEIPYQQLTQSSLGGSIGTTAFKKAGITLRVRPTIAADGTVEMLIEPEFSRLAGFTPQENQPIIDTRKTSTTVRVANHQTLVLSGLRQRTDTGEFNGIPFLKDLRGVGPLFRSRDTNVRESELIVFIMPEIIGYDDSVDTRSYQSLETIKCRLESIPRAEGCPGPGAGSGDASDCDWNDDRLLQLPSVESEDAPQAPATDSPPAEPSDAASAMRPHYEARYRATNGKLKDRTRLTTPNPDAADEKQPFWRRMTGS